MPKQLELCSNCPYISFIPYLRANQVNYTREKTEVTNHKLCQQLRALAKRRNWKFSTCPYYHETETMESWV